MLALVLALVLERLCFFVRRGLRDGGVVVPRLILSFPQSLPARRSMQYSSIQVFSIRFVRRRRNGCFIR